MKSDNAMFYTLGCDDPYEVPVNKKTQSICTTLEGFGIKTTGNRVEFEGKPVGLDDKLLPGKYLIMPHIQGG